MSKVQQQSKESSSSESSKPWWRYPIVWLVVGGPAIVVVASFVTASIAIKHVDPVLDTSAGQVKTAAEAPALKGRNQAAELATRPADR